MPNPAQSDIDLARIRTIAGAHVRSEQQVRAKAASMLHDQIAQTLVAARMKVALLRHDHDGNAGTSLDFVTVRLDEALDLVRSLSRTMAPPVAVRDMPLDAALRWFIRDMRERRGRELTLTAPTDLAVPGVGSIDPVARFTLFEALDTLTELANQPTLAISVVPEFDHVAIAIDVPDTIDISELAERAGWCGVRIELVPGSPMKCVLTVRRLAEPAVRA